MNDIEKWYEKLTYEDAKDLLQEKLTNMKMNFIAAGYFMKYIRDHELYTEDIYGIKRTTASRWMQMNDRFSVDGNTPILADEYKAFGKSQLQEMLYLEDEQLSQVTPDMTVREIREVRTPEEVEEEPVSVLGYPLRVYPEGSLLSTPGCGKQDCFSCHRDGCELRQVDCYCVEAPMGNPFSCTTLNVVDRLRETVKSHCQFVNEDLAYHRTGDGQPVPCCKECQSPCGYECDRSVQARQKLKEEKAEEKCATSHKSGTCIHRPEFSCTLPEASKLAVGDGIDCSMKCCWDCLKRMECGYRCNSAAGHPIEEQIPGQMHVEDYPEILPEPEDTDSDIDNDEDNVVIEQPENVINQTESVIEDDENVIDAEYTEVAAENTEVEEMRCQEAVNLDELTFSQIAIWDYLEEEERTLAEYEKVNSEDGGLPLNLMMRQRMLVKGLRLLMEHEADQDDQEEDDEPEEFEPVQPELPVLRNNDQRKEWLKDYKSWGLWYRDENIDVNYYKYDFSDGSRLVVAEYPQRRVYWKPNEFADEHYYHLLEKNCKCCTSEKRFDRTYMHSTDSETYLVEFLKNLQKGDKK